MVPAFLLLMTLAAVLVSAAIVVSTTSCAHQKKAAERYYCPMHPTYVSDHPGDCPICGMRLVPVKGSARDSATTDSARTAGGATGTSARARPETQSAAEPNPPAAQPGEQSEAQRGQKRILYYRSPMNPQVTSPVPAKDEMGMDFVPVYEEPETSAATVAGYAPVTVSPEGLRLAGIRTVPAARGILNRTVRAVGMVVSDERRIHQVTLKSGGYVEHLFVGATGQMVRRGDPILSIYSPDLLAAQAEYLRARRAAQDLSSSELAGVRAGAEDLLRVSRERLKLLDVPDALIREIERTGEPQQDVTFTAPVSGYVTAKSVVAGMRVEPGTELYTVTDLSKVWIEADFYEYEAASLKVGQEARLTLPYEPAVSLAGKVSFIYPTVDPASRTLRVRFETENPNLVLKPGMYANAELQIQSGEGILVPDNAVLDTGQRQLVFVETSPGTFIPREVRVGFRGDGRALLLDGVRGGEPVAVQANFLLDSESRIRAAFSGTGK